MTVFVFLALLVYAAVCAAAAAVGWLSGVVTRRLARRHPFLLTAHRRCRHPWIATLVAAAALIALPLLPLGPDARGTVRHALTIAVIVSVTWLGVRAARVAEDGLFRRLRVDVADNRRIRKVRTQVTVVRRILVALLVLLAAAAVLMTFARLRTLGASLLASAGVAGIVGGLAAQSTLGNVFAGLQLAFTDALRFDDVVVVEGEWGRIEELTLTYVVVHLWDERRLVLPTSYFTTKPFQNWTRTGSRVLGAATLYLDYSTPVEALRAEAERVIAASPLWDREDWVLQVVDTTETTMVVRVLASAADAGQAFDLRCEIREKLLGWLNARHPYALPRARIAPGVDLREAAPIIGAD
ncbi:MAG TPA: mechanosensitive ion channel domain-containing protein [Mycobacteriales bacterium]|nr:mechanosensitive ion channel domain-containing protein [Mycobacteriales bacterium]